MHRALAIAVLGLWFTACGKESPPTTPTTGSGTRIIGLSGNLSFGRVLVGQTSTAVLTVANQGTAALTLSALTISNDVSGAFASDFKSGTIAAGGSQAVTIRFTPGSARNYNGTLTVNGDQTAGTNTTAISGTGTTSAPIPPGPSNLTLTGTVTDGTTRDALANITIQIVSGSNLGQSAVTDSRGNYSMSGLSADTFTLLATTDGYYPATKRVTLSTSARVDLVLQRTGPATLFSMSGTGDAVFDVPRSVSRVRVEANFGGSCQNFIVSIGGHLLVNEILGTCSASTTGRNFSDTYTTTGGIAEITNSNGVNWTISESP